jgi:D-serine deaminase-like pyridoxal phosphate-dependent protein
MFSTDHVTQVLATRSRAQAHDAWRDAANLVSTRWRLFVEADSGGRRWAFASYVAALDAEEAAAAEMASLAEPMAA